MFKKLIPLVLVLATSLSYGANQPNSGYTPGSVLVTGDLASPYVSGVANPINTNAEFAKLYCDTNWITSGVYKDANGASQKIDKISAATKTYVLNHYGITDASSVVLVHRVPTEIGGTNLRNNVYPIDVKSATYAVKDLDALTRNVKKSMCTKVNGSYDVGSNLSVAEAQALFTGNWQSAYATRVPNAVSTVPNSTPTPGPTDTPTPTNTPTATNTPTPTATRTNTPTPTATNTPTPTP